MNKIIAFFKKEMMLTLALAAAVIALFITPPSMAMLDDIDWRTLGTLFMMLTVLEGFKQENIFLPFIRFANRFVTMRGLSFFLICCVFFSSMFVTNDVSLIIFVPLTIILFRAGNKEKYILPVISMENIAAIRGSLLTPFGSPQNLFLYGQSGVSAFEFMLHMSPLWISSFFLLFIFVTVLYRKDLKETVKNVNTIPSAGKTGSGSAAGATSSTSVEWKTKSKTSVYHISLSVRHDRLDHRKPHRPVVLGYSGTPDRDPDRGPEDPLKDRLRAAAHLPVFLRFLVVDRRQRKNLGLPDRLGRRT